MPKRQRLQLGKSHNTARRYLNHGSNPCLRLEILPSRAELDWLAGRPSLTVGLGLSFNTGLTTCMDESSQRFLQNSRTWVGGQASQPTGLHSLWVSAGVLILISQPGIQVKDLGMFTLSSKV